MGRKTCPARAPAIGSACSAPTAPSSKSFAPAKGELGLSNAMVDELAGMTAGYWDKIAARIKSPTLFSLMAFAGALGWVIQFVEDPDSRIRERWEKRRERAAHGNSRLSTAALKKARTILLSEWAINANARRWSGTTPRNAPPSSQNSMPQELRNGVVPGRERPRINQSDVCEVRDNYLRRRFDGFVISTGLSVATAMGLSLGGPHKVNSRRRSRASSIVSSTMDR